MVSSDYGFKVTNVKLIDSDNSHPAINYIKIAGDISAESSHSQIYTAIVESINRVCL